MLLKVRWSNASSTPPMTAAVCGSSPPPPPPDNAAILTAPPRPFGGVFVARRALRVGGKPFSLRLPLPATPLALRILSRVWNHRLALRSSSPSPSSKSKSFAKEDLLRLPIVPLSPVSGLLPLCLDPAGCSDDDDDDDGVGVAPAAGEARWHISIDTIRLRVASRP